MRPACLFVVTVVASACLDPIIGPRSTVHVVIDLTGPTVISDVCYALAVTSQTGDLTLGRGQLGPHASLDAARADGALCTSRGVDAGRLELTAACQFGESTLDVWLVGIFAADGTSLADELYTPCGGPEACTKTFTCAANGSTVVPVDILVAEPSHQGFFDIGILAEPPDGAEELCYAVRVANDEGVIWEHARLCSGAYGDGAGGSVQYVGPCSAAASGHTVTAWIHTPDQEAPGWVNPCPLIGDIADSRTWRGGCTTQATCFENADVTVRLDLSR